MDDLRGACRSVHRLALVRLLAPKRFDRMANLDEHRGAQVVTFGKQRIRALSGNALSIIAVLLHKQVGGAPYIALLHR
jgi:hypothetical protein